MSRQTSAVELKAQIEAERGGRPFLVYRDGDDEQLIVVIEAGTEQLWIGRSPSTQVRLDWDGSVSSLHAQVRVIGEECTLVDDGLSRNGSFVNEERVHGRCRLRDGDVVRIGQTPMQFRAPGQAGVELTMTAAETSGPLAISPGQRRVLVALCRPFKDGGAFATAPTNQQIAGELHLSVDAVKSHLRALFERLGVDDMPQNRKRVALVERALHSGIVTRREL